MKKLLLLLLFIPLMSCSDDFTTLVITNVDSEFPIVRVNLVGYEFADINITEGQTKSFDLSDGIDGGLTDVNVSIRISCSPQMPITRSRNLDFSSGLASITIIDNRTSITYPMNCSDAVIQD
jgi:hypothetical protein